MSQEIALVYNLKEERLQKVRSVLMFLGIRVREVKAAEYGIPIGELITNTTNVEGDAGETFSEEMMVLSVAPNRIDALIQRFRRHKIALPTLTAVLTETNAQWDSIALAAELRQEREAIMQGKTEH